MASQTWLLSTSLVGALLLSMSGCLSGAGTESNSTGLDTNGGTGLDEGLDGDGFLECIQFLDACEQDPYCRCFVECAVESEDPNPNVCLAKCNLAQIPFWADQFITCAADTEIVGTEPGLGEQG